MTEHNLTFDMDMSEYRIPIRDRMYLLKSEEQSMKNKRTKKIFPRMATGTGGEEDLQNLYYSSLLEYLDHVCCSYKISYNENNMKSF
jgi:hypothetical protein